MILRHLEDIVRIRVVTKVLLIVHEEGFPAVTIKGESATELKPIAFQVARFAPAPGFRGSEPHGGFQEGEDRSTARLEGTIECSWLINKELALEKLLLDELILAQMLRGDAHQRHAKLVQLGLDGGELLSAVAAENATKASEHAEHDALATLAHLS